MEASRLSMRLKRHKAEKKKKGLHLEDNFHISRHQRQLLLKRTCKISEWHA
jgi:hypothetical protein